MQITRLSHNKDQWYLNVYEVPWWAYTISAAYEKLLSALGEPCCYVHQCQHRPQPCCLYDHVEHKRTWAGYIIDHLPDVKYYKANHGEIYQESLQDAAQYLQWRLISNSIAMLAVRKEKVVFQTPLSRDEAHSWDPELVEDQGMLDDSEGIQRSDDDNENFAEKE